MADYLDNYEDIVFLDSEIEDDDDSAPVGELISVVDGKVYKAADLQGEKKDGAAEDGTPCRDSFRSGGTIRRRSPGKLSRRSPRPLPKTHPKRKTSFPLRILSISTRPA